jgi:hypothetical protein
MLPVILAAVGGYLVYDSLKSKKFADGGVEGEDDGYQKYWSKQGEYEYEQKAKAQALTEWRSSKTKIVKEGDKYVLYVKFRKLADGGEMEGAQEIWDSSKPVKNTKWVTNAIFQ